MTETVFVQNLSVIVFSDWKEHIYLYGLLILLLGVLYLVIYPLIRWAMSLQLIRTVTFILTILLLILSIYIYTTIIRNVSLLITLQKLFESIVLFGSILLMYTLIRSRIITKKQKT